jgi:hypothetical protein
MNRILPALVLVSALTQVSSAQVIPNAGFEDWFEGNPVDWWTDNIVGLVVPIVQTSDAHGGSSAVMGTVIEFSGNAYTPILSAGSDASGFPINFRPEALHGWYKFESDSGDNFSLTFVVMNNGQGIGAGFLYSPIVRTVYTEFVLNVNYNLPDTPDSAAILCLISNSPRVHIGSSFTLDDLAFGPATGVDDEPILAHAFLLDQNYPNPFNPSTLIPFEIAGEGLVVLKVFDLLGREIATLVNEEMSPGRYRAEFDATDLPAGMYMYRLQMDGRSETRKMVVLK